MNLSAIEYFIIEEQKIEFVYLETDVLSWTDNWDDYVYVKAPELYGILRKQNIVNVYCIEYGGYALLEVTYWTQDWQMGIGPDYFKLSPEQMDQFFNYYCSVYSKEKIDWLKEGF